MSRLQREYVWLNYFDQKATALCPCCLSTRISLRRSYSWERGHMIPHRRLGADIYANVRPICTACNASDKKFETNYHYMVSIGTMLAEDLEPALAKIEMMFNLQRTEPERFECCAFLKRKILVDAPAPKPKIESIDDDDSECTAVAVRKSSRRRPPAQIKIPVKCTHARIPRSSHCGIHERPNRRPETEKERIYRKLLATANEALKMTDVWDEEELQDFRDVRYDALEDLARENEKNGGRSGIRPF